MRTLTDDLLRLILCAVAPRPLAVRRQQALVCRKWMALVRSDELCLLQLVVSGGSSDLVDVGRSFVREDTLQVPVRLEASKRSMAIVGERLEAGGAYSRVWSGRSGQ